MRILIIGRGFPTDRYKLNGIFEFDQAKALAKIGHEVLFLSVDIRSIRRIRKFGTYEIEKEGVLVHNTSFPCGAAPYWVQDYIIGTLLRKQYARLVKKYGKPDIIHAHFPDYGYAAVKELRNTGIPIVITEHEPLVLENRIRENTYRMECVSCKAADKIISVSSFLAGQIKDRIGRDSVVIPNMVDAEMFYYNGKKKRTKEFTFVCVAALNPGKRVSFLTEVFADFLKIFPQARLFIVGDGLERKKIEKIVLQHKMAGRVFLMGIRSRKEIKEIFDQSDCFVLPSMSETFGCVYIEALASGLPVIATKCGGPEDFVDESNGIMVGVDSREELLQAMQKMIREIGKYNPEEISKAAIDRFSDVAVAKQIEKVYAEIIKDGR